MKTSLSLQMEGELLVLNLDLSEHLTIQQKLEAEGKSNGLYLKNDILYSAISRGIEMFCVETTENINKIDEFSEGKRKYQTLHVTDEYLYGAYKQSSLFSKQYGL
ncbi:MAG: hypothetical protein R6U04_14405 [Bacteroidales bacterium]